MGAKIEFELDDQPLDDGTQVVTPQGEIDALTAPTLGRRLLRLADEGKTGVVVDLSRVTFMDSFGIGVLLNALRCLSTQHVGLVLVCPTERVTRPFEVMGLNGCLRTFRTLDEALRGLAAVPAGLA
jgi:anti-sigma B factor antagonist